MTTTALVPVFAGTINGQSAQLCNARDLHGFLAVGRDFTNWIKGRIEEYGFTDGEDFCSPDLASKRRGRGGHNRTDYHLTLDMAKELAMIENNDQGRAVRRYFIQCERSAQQAVPIPADTAMLRAIIRAELAVADQSSGELLPPQQAKEITERLDRLCQMFHPFSNPFADALGIYRALRGLHPKVGIREPGYRRVIEHPTDRSHQR